MISEQELKRQLGRPIVCCINTALDAGDMPDLQLKISADWVPVAEHPRRFNGPVVNEVTVLIASDSFQNRDIALKLRDSRLQRISETHRSYDALQYPLLFPFAVMMAITSSTGRSIHKQDCQLPKNSASDFYAYRLMVRDDSFNSIHKHKSLFQQFVVDMYVKIESERLN